MISIIFLWQFWIQKQIFAYFLSNNNLLLIKLPYLTFNSKLHLKIPIILEIQTTKITYQLEIIQMINQQFLVEWKFQLLQIINNLFIQTFKQNLVPPNLKTTYQKILTNQIKFSQIINLILKLIELHGIKCQNQVIFKQIFVNNMPRHWNHQKIINYCFAQHWKFKKYNCQNTNLQIITFWFEQLQTYAGLQIKLNQWNWWQQFILK